MRHAQIALPEHQERVAHGWQRQHLRASKHNWQVPRRVAQAASPVKTQTGLFQARKHAACAGLAGGAVALPN